MTEAQVDELVTRSTAGEGVEAILDSMGLDSDVTIAEIRRHPTAGTRLLDAKRTQKAAARARLAASQQISK